MVRQCEGANQREPFHLLVKTADCSPSWVVIARSNNVCVCVCAAVFSVAKLAPIIMVPVWRLAIHCEASIRIRFGRRARFWPASIQLATLTLLTKNLPPNALPSIAAIGPTKDQAQIAVSSAL